MLYTVSGCPGVGKTSLFRMVLAALSNAHLLRSYTTREPRETDLDGEYTYLSLQEWQFIESRGEFAWNTTVRGALYGTRRNDIRAALDSSDIFLATIVPAKVWDIYTLAQSFGLAQRVRSVYILSPDHRIIFERLTKDRGLTEDKANRDLTECVEWDDLARRERRFSYHFIHDRNSLDDKFTDLRNLLLRT